MKYDYGDVTEESVLLIRDFQSEDLNRELNCSVRNQQGFMTRRAQLEEEGEEDSDQNQQEVPLVSSAPGLILNESRVLFEKQTSRSQTFSVLSILTFYFLFLSL